MTDRMVIGIAGMPGSGKNTVHEVAKRYGLPVFVMGDEVRVEAAKRGLEPTPENLGRLMLKLREEEGPEALAKRLVPKIMASKSPVIIVDGIRSMDEVREFRKFFPDFKLLAVHASPETRFKRLLKRKRSDDPKSWESFLERDDREVRVGLGEVIAKADFLVVNEGTLDQYMGELDRLFRKWLKIE